MANTVISPARSFLKVKSTNFYVFCLLWATTFILYLPAAKAGWVLDSAGWLYNIRTMPFWDYINRTQSKIDSLYQVTQFTTYVFYRLFGAQAWAWHLLQVSMHAVNALLVFIVCKHIFDDSGIKRGFSIALGGVLLFTVCPHISEVIVWEAAYHYLQGFLFLLLIVYWVQKYHYHGQVKYAWWSGILFFLSTFSLEVFYLTPWFVLSLAIYYRVALRYDKQVFKKVMLYFFIPQLFFFFLNLILLHVIYHSIYGHINGDMVQPLVNYLCKLPKYAFHILLFGRYFSYDIRSKVYHLCETPKALIAFYSLFLIVCIYIAARFRNMSMKGKAAVLVFSWLLLTVSILIPLAFPDILLVTYDRYTYFLDAFVYMLLGLLASYISSKFLKMLLLFAYGLTNIYFIIKVNRYWLQSTRINNHLLNDLPNPGNRTVILLNNPENMNGIPMIGAEESGAYKMMHNLFAAHEINNTVYDVVSYNMVAATDGAHVTVINDSMLHVTLNQWGTWWWYARRGAGSYDNTDYRLNMVDGGHWYELTLHHAVQQYLVLYNIGDAWKEVDWSKKNQDEY